MSIPVLQWAFELRIDGPRKAVLLALAWHADSAGACFPSVPRIAHFAGLTERAARASLRVLEVQGLVRTIRVTGQRSKYHLAMSGPEAGTPEQYSAPTPEHGSAPRPEEPRNIIPPTPEQHSAQPRNVIPETPERGAPKPESKGQVNCQEESHGGTCARDGSAGKLFDDEAQMLSAEPRKKATVTRLSAVDPEWWPDPAGIVFAQARGITDIDGEVQRFRDHHLAKGSKMASWPAAWRTWCGNAQRFAPRNQYLRPPARVTAPGKTDYLNLGRAAGAAAFGDEDDNIITIDGEIE